MPSLADWWLVTWEDGNGLKQAIFDDARWAQQFLYGCRPGNNNANIYPCLKSSALLALREALA